MPSPCGNSDVTSLRSVAARRTWGPPRPLMAAMRGSLAGTSSSAEGVGAAAGLPPLAAGVLPPVALGGVVKTPVAREPSMGAVTFWWNPPAPPADGDWEVGLGAMGIVGGGWLRVVRGRLWSGGLGLKMGADQWAL